MKMPFDSMDSGSRPSRTRLSKSTPADAPRAARLSVLSPAHLPLHERVFDDGTALAVALAQSVAANLRDAIARRGRASIGLSGGNTPRAFLSALSKQSLDWSHVTVVPVDERWLPPAHARSNERLLREALLQGGAAQAKLLPLWRPAPTPESALQPVLTRVANEALPLDVAVLGIGGDGHVASLFPDLGCSTSGHREIGLQPHGRAPVLAVRSAAAPEPRMTLTLSAILTAPALYLHIEGAAKRVVLDAAVRDADSPLPIRALLAGASSPPTLYWSP